MVIAAVVTLPFGLVDGAGDLLDGELLAIAFGVAILSSAIPYSFELEALRRLPQSTFGVLMSLEPAVAATAGSSCWARTSRRARSWRSAWCWRQARARSARRAELDAQEADPLVRGLRALRCPPGAPRARRSRAPAGAGSADRTGLSGAVAHRERGAAGVADEALMGAGIAESGGWAPRGRRPALGRVLLVAHAPIIAPNLPAGANTSLRIVRVDGFTLATLRLPSPLPAGGPGFAPLRLARDGRDGPDPAPDRQGGRRDLEATPSTRTRSGRSRSRSSAPACFAWG